MNTLEAMKALLTGQKIRCIHWSNGEYVFLNNKGVPVGNNGTPRHVTFLTSEQRNLWEIYHEPKWYEDKSNFPVLCKVWDNAVQKKGTNLRVIVSYTGDSHMYHFKSDTTNWKHAQRILVDGKPVQSYTLEA